MGSSFAKVARAVALGSIGFGLLLAFTGGCSGDDDSKEKNAGSSSSSGGTSANAESSCSSMCTQTGFSSARVDVQPSETNCFCAGPGTVTTEGCTQLCT